MSPTTNHQSPTTLQGWVTTFYIPYRGRKLGPYYTRSWKVNGKLKRQYIKHADLERVRAACQRNRDHRHATTATSREVNTLPRQSQLPCPNGQAPKDRLDP